jgi:DNA-binding NarL/FixJ family response regulator
MPQQDAGVEVPVRVAIIDNHDVVHAGVRAWCSQAHPPIDFVGEFRDPAEFIKLYPSPAAGPDVALFDLQGTDDRPAFDTLHRLCQAGHRVVVFSHLNSDDVILKSLELGATTYLTKSEGRSHLIEAIHSASSTTPYVGPATARALLNDDNARRPNLSDREKEVLVAWFQTGSKDLVGERLFIAPSTVRTHLQRARAKYAALGRPAPTKSALLARAIEDGILSLADL